MIKLIIYVLKLESNFYYVGRSKDFSKRLSNHLNGKGSAWTKIHKPIEVQETYEFDCFSDADEDKWENFITIKMMKIHGWRKVRGGFWSNVNEYETIKGLHHHGYFTELNINDIEFDSYRYVIFALKLKSDKFFIGYSSNLDLALKRHKKGKASKWTQLYEPIEITEAVEIFCESGKIELEKVDNLVLKYFKRYGYLNVRGGSYTNVDPEQHFAQVKKALVIDELSKFKWQ